MIQANLFDEVGVERGFDLRGQLLRVDQETRTYVDLLLERGAKLEVHDDGEIDGVRLATAKGAGLRMLRENRSRGVRRAWYRPCHGDETGWVVMEGQFWKFVRYEPRLERQLGARAEKSDSARAKRTHWKYP